MPLSTELCRVYSVRSVLYCSLNAYRKLEQEHKEKLAAMRSELMQEMDQLQQQAGLQREELEAEVQKIREDESFLRDHLSISVKVLGRFVLICLDDGCNAQSSFFSHQTSHLLVFKDLSSLSLFLGKQTSGNGVAGQRWKTDGRSKPDCKTPDGCGQHYERKGSETFYGLSSLHRLFLACVWFILCFLCSTLLTNDLIMFSLETWTPAAQTSSGKRNELNSYVAAMKLSTG